VSLELILDKSSGKFTGEALVDFTSENEAKIAFSSMMGLQVDKKYLYVKKMQPPTEEELLE